MESRSVTVSSPATIANLVCGFDILGLALQEPYDLMTVKLISEPVIRITNTDSFGLPTDPAQNVAGAVLKAVMESCKRDIGFEVSMEKRIKPGSGIGSSAASAAAAAVAANQLLDGIFSTQELISLAMEGEKLASGSRHADNVAPCILGGITLVRSTDPLDVVPIAYPELCVTVIHPQIEVRTSDARQVLKPEVSLKQAIQQWGNVAGLVAGLFRKDYDLIGRSLEDVIIEPQRSILIPGLPEVKKACKATRALGGGISGSGPSLFMLSRDVAAAREVESAMKAVYDQLNIGYNSYVTGISSQGVSVVTG